MAKTLWRESGWRAALFFKTVTAKNRTIAGGFKRHFATLSALTADSRKHLFGAVVASVSAPAKGWSAFGGELASAAKSFVTPPLVKFVKIFHIF